MQDDWRSLTYEEANATLKKWREEHARRSEEVVEIWEFVLSRYAAALKGELWAVLEQVTIAALDQARHDLAIECLQQLHRRFPKSTRVTKLQAMRLEAIGNYEDAEELYRRLIEGDDTNPLFRKRCIAILIARGDRQSAIRELNKYLEIFANDSEAWLQQGELFLQEADFGRAAFCFEELLLSNPQNPTYLLKMAEIRYTLGGPDNVEIARAYYERSLALAPSAQAMYGLILCNNQLLHLKTGIGQQRRRDLARSALNACDQLANLYEGKATGGGGDETPREDFGRQLSVVVQTLRGCFTE
ncbi:hypothetical protein niasHT_015729 [Heterodera trifolii]|uniref:ER membrane protein complex subunit 2 n=1 Tax=Heterodera trifolii TaxID=157864 RepID=A0ABD2L4W1_9BILA